MKSNQKREPRGIWDIFKNSPNDVKEDIDDSEHIKVSVEPDPKLTEHGPLLYLSQLVTKLEVKCNCHPTQ